MAFGIRCKSFLEREFKGGVERPSQDYLQQEIIFSQARVQIKGAE